MQENFREAKISEKGKGGGGGAPAEEVNTHQDFASKTRIV